MTTITRIAIPTKGRLSEPSLDLVRAAGLVFETSSGALSVVARNMPIEVLFVRAADIPDLVRNGVADYGITGLDLVVESDAESAVLQDLRFGRCTLTAAVAESSSVTTIEDFAGLRVATSHQATVNRFFAEKGIHITTVPLHGSVEVAPKLNIADAVVDLVSSGSTMMINGLRPVATILESQAVLIGQPGVGGSSLATMIRAVVVAKRKRYVLMNVREESIAAVQGLIPGADSPTVVSLAQDGMYAVHSVVDADEMWHVLPALEAAGATAILVLPIEQMIP
ncbi:MAG: ATP phosphoribosyltransferase [Actinomycetota bacterium]|nr:ATP phosphoribosyltransferase [Actinomycetota bacterium]